MPWSEVDYVNIWLATWGAERIFKLMLQLPGDPNHSVLSSRLLLSDS